MERQIRLEILQQDDLYIPPKAPPQPAKGPKIRALPEMFKKTLKVSRDDGPDALFDEPFDSTSTTIVASPFDKTTLQRLALKNFIAHSPRALPDLDLPKSLIHEWRLGSLPHSNVISSWKDASKHAVIAKKMNVLASSQSSRASSASKIGLRRTTPHRLSVLHPNLEKLNAHEIPEVTSKRSERPATASVVSFEPKLQLPQSRVRPNTAKPIQQREETTKAVKKRDNSATNSKLSSKKCAMRTNQTVLSNIATAFKESLLIPAAMTLEQFDDIVTYESHTPEEWVALGPSKGQLGTPAFSKYHIMGREADDWRWQECFVMSYSSETSTYGIQWLNGGQKVVKRFNLLFAEESRQRFYNRIETATNARNALIAECDAEKAIWEWEMNSLAPLDDKLKLGALEKIGMDITRKHLTVIVRPHLYRMKY